MRWGLYQIVALLEDDEAAQKKGISVLLHSPGRGFVSEFPPISELFGYIKEAAFLARSLPYRTTSFHYCYDDPVTKVFLGVLQAGLGREIRLRVRAHFGMFPFYCSNQQPNS
jgi:hypothetical protein